MLCNIKKDRFTISDKLWEGHQKRKKEHKERGNGFGYCLFNENSEYTNTLSARYYKDGSEILIDQSNAGKNPRKLTPRECADLQGFPADYIINAVSQGQIYKQFGNSVCMTVVDAIAEKLTSALKSAGSFHLKK
ncbi:DNA cytosine methyltransferase [Morganella psychrotolerans]|uniref:DNA cytosine methyltransferase n=1 Tax=Morganella psychrotolerans TaxID=368603 RepID=UPI000AEEB7AF|nr:DNA cytosine methyltransferase [Morganella psychrotolerans]